MHALPDSARSVDLQPLGDLVVTARQLVPGGSVLAGPAKFGTHPSDESCPALRWRPNTRSESRLARRGDVLADRVPIQPQALRDRPQRPSRRPMLQHFDDVCHPQTPSCHSHSSARVVANGPKRRLRGGELAEHPGGELPEHFGSAWWNYLNADIDSPRLVGWLNDLGLVACCHGSHSSSRRRGWLSEQGESDGQANCRTLVLK